jgi:hypothetical protein
LESNPFVAAIAERLVFRMPTATKADGGAASEVKSVSFRIMERKLALQPQGAIVPYVHPCFSQLILLVVIPA